MFIASYKSLPDQLNFWKQFSKQANISPFQVFFECSSVLINTSKNPAFIGFEKLEDTLWCSGYPTKAQGKNFHFKFI